jgi:hypothetical protein
VRLSALLERMRRAWYGEDLEMVTPRPGLEREKVLVGEQQVRIRRGEQFSAEIYVRSRPPPDEAELERARQAQRRLIESEAKLSMSVRRLQALWKRPVEVERHLQDVVDALPLCATVELSLSHEVDRSALEALGVGLEQPVRGRDLEFVLWAEGAARRAVRSHDLRLELREGWLHASWTGVLAERDGAIARVSALAEALARPPADPWRQIDIWLRRPLAARQQLAAFALSVTGPVRERVLRALMADPDSDYAWEVLREHSGFDDWLRFACDAGRTEQARLSAAEHLSLGTREQRCRAACTLFQAPLLRQEACVLLEGLAGAEVEAAWLTLGEQTREPELLRRIVAGLGQGGTPRALPWLYTLREGLGPLQFQLRDLVEIAMRDIRERSGAVPGALSLAELPEAGALSVAAGPGQLSPTPERRGP